MTALIEPDGRVDVLGRRRHVASHQRAAVTSILGTQVDIATESEFLDCVSSVIELDRPSVFVGLYAALFRQLARDEVYRRDVAQSVTYPDGRGVVTEMHRRGVPRAERLATTDVVHPVAERAAAAGWRVGLFGARPGVAERAAAQLTAAHPGLQVVAVWDGYRDLDADDVRDARLDVLFVGTGAGHQERWAQDVAVKAGVPATLTCGGLLDFLAGDKRRAPRWVQRAGLEWAFRVALEPRRLFVRYLLGNGYFLTATRRERLIQA